MPLKGPRAEVPGRNFSGMPAIREMAMEEIRSWAGEKVYPEYSLVTQMREGGFHTRHADNERLVGSQWQDNHTPQRAFTSMIYLNTCGDDYEGGELNFPTKDRMISPEAGMLVGFPCHHEFEHEVFPVTNGLRYAISIWYTRDASLSEKS